MLNQSVHPINSLLINSDICTNLDNGNNTFLFRFSRNVTTTNTTKASISMLSIPFSWYNISANLHNNTFQYVWYDGATAGNTPGLGNGVTYSVTIPDGHYTISELNSFLQFSMIQNQHYLIDQYGNHVYFLEFCENSTLYRNQINTYRLPAALPAGWTNPGTGVRFGPNAYGPLGWKMPRIILTDTNYGVYATSLFVYFGFLEANQTSPVSYPYQEILPPYANDPLVNLSEGVIGDISPQTEIAHSVTITCDYIDNQLRTASGPKTSSFIIATSDVDCKFGEYLTNSQFFTTWIPMMSGQTINQMNFKICDQDGNLLNLEDPDVNIEILLTDLRYS